MGQMSLQCRPNISVPHTSHSSLEGSKASESFNSVCWLISISIISHLMDLTRDFTVAVFVVWKGKVLLHWHRKLGMWLPPGGHIENNELPDEAAVREVFEETGVRVELVGEKRKDVFDPLQLVRPLGIQLENIAPGHQHIDLIYVARPVGRTTIDQDFSKDKVGWYSSEELGVVSVSAEVAGWCERALAEFS